MYGFYDIISDINRIKLYLRRINAPIDTMAMVMHKLALVWSKLRFNTYADTT